MKNPRALMLVLLVGLVGTAFSMLSLPSATAASASPKCAAVKTQVRAYAKLEKPLSVQYAPVNGRWSWTFATPNTDLYIDLQKQIVDLQVKMFTFSRANLGCFTPSQKVYAVNSLKNWKEIQANLSTRPNWLAGFSFVPIVWDSIYSK